MPGQGNIRRKIAIKVAFEQEPSHIKNSESQSTTIPIDKDHLVGFRLDGIGGPSIGMNNRRGQLWVRANLLESLSKSRMERELFLWKQMLHGCQMGQSSGKSMLWVPVRLANRRKARNHLVGIHHVQMAKRSTQQA